MIFTLPVQMRFLLSSDLATLFTGRTMEIKVYPFSFVEYLTYYEITDGYDDAFDQYVKTGGNARCLCL